MTERTAHRVLLVSPLDLDQAWNNREHHLVNELRRRNWRVTLIFKALNRSKRFRDLLLDTCTMRVQESVDGALTKLRVDPFFNYCAGLRVSSDMAISSPPPERKVSARVILQPERRMPRSDWATDRRSPYARRMVRSALVRMFSPLRVLRDVFSVPCMIAAALWKTRGTFDVGVGFGPWGAMTVNALKIMRRVEKTVYEDRDFEPGLLPDRLRQWYTAAAEKAMVRRSDLLFSIGYRLAALRRSQTGREAHVIPTGVHWRNFAVARERSGNGRKLIHVGNLVSWSGVDITIRAMPALLQEYPDTELIVIGDGIPAFVSYLRHLAEKLSVREAVRFLGARPYSKMPELLAEGDIGLAAAKPVPYRQYAYPLKVIEYMASGLPVIGTTDTETAEILARHDCGLSTSFDPDAQARAILTLFSDRALYDRLRFHGIQASSTMEWQSLMEREVDLMFRRTGNHKNRWCAAES